jgi:hypothetical protein
MPTTPDDAGLVPLVLARAARPERRAAFEARPRRVAGRGERRDRGTYLREVRDLRGRRRELASRPRPKAGPARSSMVGPFRTRRRPRPGAAGLGPGWSATRCRTPAPGTSTCSWARRRLTRARRGRCEALTPRAGAPAMLDGMRARVMHALPARGGPEARRAPHAPEPRPLRTAPRRGGGAFVCRRRHPCSNRPSPRSDPRPTPARAAGGARRLAGPQGARHRAPQGARRLAPEERREAPAPRSTPSSARIEARSTSASASSTRPPSRTSSSASASTSPCPACAPPPARTTCSRR